MRWDIETRVPHNSYDYFEKTLITDNGFREYDVRWIIGKEINPNGFVVLGKAYGTMMQEVLKESVIVVGHDFRSYSQDLSRSLIVGLLSTGVRVIDLGLTLTPMVYYGQHHFNCKAGIQVTASHNENGWTGLKIANGLSSTLGPEGILAFKEFVKGGKFISGQGTYETFDGIYEFYKKDALRGAKLSKPIKVVLAAGNGTAGRYAPQVLRELGCDVVELDCTPDWEFKRHNPNPEDLSFLHDISRVTKENGADLGIGIDGDGDRVGVVDGLGREVFSDKLGLLIARWICQDHPGRSIVMDVKSTGLFHDDAVLRAMNDVDFPVA
ncbi:MAG TPA: phosphomannomutase/phosphoglucomutase, partial [Candidatus Hydrogenedentes bacterium]|nr:phosphomannomutase/phosphoglucomutase [Candidatus Hydrogenedentota bacterium]